MIHRIENVIYGVDFRKHLGKRNPLDPFWAAHQAMVTYLGGFLAPGRDAGSIAESPPDKPAA